MMIRNNVSRYDVAMHAIRGAGRHNAKISLRQHELISNLKSEMKKIQAYIMANGTGEDYLLFFTYVLLASFTNHYCLS